MRDLKNDSQVTRLLRLIAIIGTLAAAFINLFSVAAIEPNQEYSFYALALIVAGVLVSLFVFLPRAAAQVWRNPDVLIPIGLYATVSQFAGYFIQIPKVMFLTARGLDLTFLTFNAIFIWIFYIILNVCFIGWMMRTILQLVRTGKVDVVASFRDVRWWFPRTLAVIVLGWIPVAFLMLLMLPLVFAGSYAVYSIGILAFIIFNGVFTLLWNLATSLVLPYVLLVKTNLKRAVGIGIRLSWKHKRQTLLPIILLMLVAGWVVFVQVEYSTQVKESGFGDASTYDSIHLKSNRNFTTNFVWVGDFEEKSKWHETLVKSVEQKPLDSVDFRIMLLMLLLSLVVNLRIVESIWGRKLETPVREALINQRVGATAIMVFALSLMPLEYLTERESNETSGSKPADLVAPKIYAGENLFTKREFFKIGAHETTAMSRKNAPVNLFALGRLVNLAIIGKERNIVVAGSENALILDREGALKEKISYNFDDLQNTDGYFTDVEIVDVQDDGKPEFAGEAGYPNTAFLLDAKGEVLFKYRGEKIDIDTVDVKDLDADGKKEILLDDKGILRAFDLKGVEKWSQRISTNSYSSKAHFIDTDRDGNLEIVTDAFSDAKIFEPDSKEFKPIKRPVEQDGFLYDEAQILFFDRNTLGLFDFKGNLLGRYEAPLSQIEHTRTTRRKEDFLMSKFADVYRAKAVRFKPRPNEKAYLAVLAHISAEVPNNSFIDMLYVYDADGNLVYQESLSNGMGQIKTFPNENGTESLLISEDETIWLYTAINH